MFQSYNHPNIITLIDSFDLGQNRFCIVMEPMQCNLRSFIKETSKKKLFKNFKSVVSQLFVALSFIHERGIIHADIKVSFY